jgi:hypothetical protein
MKELKRRRQNTLEESLMQKAQVRIRAHLCDILL